MFELKGYSEYKDSGVEWIGKIPKDWEVSKLRNVSSVRQNSINVESIKNADWYYYEIPTIQQTGQGKTESGENIASNKYLLQGNEILVSKLNPRKGTIVKVQKADLPIISSTELIPIVPENINTNYMFYALNNKVTSDVFNSMVTSVTNSHQRINPKQIENYLISFPNNEEQENIANFLDKKTSQIDALIVDKERLIELLEEKRQAVITETVTKGLDPNVKMKDSGIEWIGEVPEHWDLTKIKYLSDQGLIYGANESAEYDDRTLPRYIRITDIDKNGNLRENTFKSLPEIIASKYPVKKGDLLFARSGASVGKTYLHESDDDACYAGYLIKFRSNKYKLNPKYLYYYTNSYSYKRWTQSSTIQATIENISAEKYGNMQIPYPDIKVQDNIVKFLDNYVRNNQILLNEVEEQINKLKEYRESLIYEAVTGKIDVRDYATEKEETY